MVHGVEWFIRCEGERFGAGNAHDEASDQPRSGGDGDAVDFFERRDRALERVFDGRGEQRDVTPAGDLGDDAAVFGVESS